MPRRCVCALALLIACNKTTPPPPEKPPAVETPTKPADSKPRAATTAAPKKKATPEELRRYRVALQKGQALEHKGEHVAAITAFKEALEVFPDDPQALDEMGVAAFRAKDLPTAEKLAQRAAQLTTDAKLRGRALYNLGRVQEARGEKDKAIESYRHSLEDRPNKIVRERLATLDPAAAAEKDPIAPRLMAGPFASVKQWCEQTQIKKSCDEDADSDDESDDDDADKKPAFSCEEKGAGLASPPAPLRAVQIVSAQCELHDNHELTVDQRALAVRIGDQWYVGTLGDTLNTNRQDQTLEVKKVEARALAAGGPVRILVHLATSTMYRGMDATTGEETAIAGVGASGKPSLTRAILTSLHSDEDDQETGENRGASGGQLKLDFLPGETLEITGPTKKIGRGIDRETLAPLLGKHLLAFP